VPQKFCARGQISPLVTPLCSTSTDQWDRKGESFVNVHLHCIVSNLKKIIKISILPLLEKFLRTPMLFMDDGSKTNNIKYSNVETRLLIAPLLQFLATRLPLEKVATTLHHKLYVALNFLSLSHALGQHSVTCTKYFFSRVRPINAGTPNLRGSNLNTPCAWL